MPSEAEAATLPIPEFADATIGQSEFVATAIATSKQWRLAIGVVAVSTIVFAIAVPLAKTKLAQVDAFIPAYESALLVTDLVTAVLLLGQFVKLRSLSILALAAGYLFDALIIVPHALSFPGVFAPSGIIGGGAQTTVWLYTLWHAGFPISVLAYALLKGESRLPSEITTGLAFAAAAFVATLVLAISVAVTVGHDTLPQIMRGSSYTPTAILFLGASWAFSIFALGALWWRGLRSILDIWLAVVMCAWVFDIALSAVFNGGRYDLGFYLGRGYGLLAASFVLIVILLETSGLFSRLAEKSEELKGETIRLRGDVRQGLVRQQETEAQLRQAQKMEAIGNLTGGMAHDFNNLLAVVIGNLDMLVSARQTDAEVQDLGREALDAAVQGADLTKRLLAFARRQPLQPQIVDVNELIQSHAKLLHRLLGASIEVLLELSPDVWPTLVDRAQLEAALTNLATNARDAMPNGGRLSIVTINRHLDAEYAAQFPEVTPGDYVAIEVSDTGSGIPPEVLQRVFEPFYTTKERGKGSGLGLSMVYGFMKQTKGHVSVYSEPGVGTTFRLYLPPAAGATTAHVPAAIASEPRGRGEIVLAVEDVAQLRRVAVRQLTELGYHVVEAESVNSAIAVLENQPVDIVFTDIVMPGGGTGFDLAKVIRRRWPDLPVVFTSGFADANLSHSGRGLADKILNKPFRRAELARALREAVDRKADVDVAWSETEADGNRQ